MKKVYETPFTLHVRVEMESQLCAASSTVTNPNEDTGRIEEQSINTDFGGNFSTGWDSEPTSSN